MDLDPAYQMRNLGICSASVLFVVILILGICFYRLKTDISNQESSNGSRVPNISTISTNSSNVSLSTYYQPPPSYDEVIKIIFEERRKSMHESLVENEELPSYETVERQLGSKK